jgi:hypothetical protein
LKKKITKASTYPEINKALSEALNKKQKFPDFIEIKLLITKANEEHKLNIE